MTTGKSTPLFMLPQGDGQFHTLIIGTSGRGKSVLLEEEALRRGISYDELLAEMDPSAETKARWAEERQATANAEARRLHAVCEALWATAPEKGNDLAQLGETLAVLDIVENPTADQQKALLLMLPGHIVGLGIAWGFDDTEVRDKIYEFVDENREAVARQLLHPNN